MLEVTIVTAMNFIVSAVPHNRSKYRSEGGMNRVVTASCSKNSVHDQA